MSGPANTGDRSSPEWFDDDAFWIDQYAQMFSDERFAEAAQQVDQLVRLAAPAGQDVLDLGSGPGRFSIPLAQRGFHVTAVDRTPYLLEMGQKRAEAAGVTIEWVRQDMRDFARAGAFDLVISMMTSFGYFGERSDDLRVLRNILVSLRPGGRCLIDLKGKECVARTLQPTTADVSDDGTIRIKRSRVVDDWTRVCNELIVVREGQSRRTFRFDANLYSGQELRDRLESVGFEDVKLFGDLGGGEFGFEAERLIALARK
jgi:SAM-dependent methyltransferase